MFVQSEKFIIDARKLGTMIDRVHRELTDDDLRKIADTYHAWRGDRPVRKRRPAIRENLKGLGYGL